MDTTMKSEIQEAKAVFLPIFISFREALLVQSQLKGIFTDSNHLFMVWIRRSKQKQLTSKISVDSNFAFSSYVWLCVSLLPLTTVLHKVLCTSLSGENCSHFILKWFQSNSFGEVCFLEESYKNMQKNSNFENFETASIRHQEVCL